MVHCSQRSRKQPPATIMVRFDGYTGPPYFMETGKERIVSIFRSSRDFMYMQQMCTRTQFPLTVAYSITVHKSQGPTLELAVMDVTTPGFVSGLTYVMVSRVKKLQGVMFDAAFDLGDLQSHESATSRDREFDQQRRSRQVIQIT